MGEIVDTNSQIANRLQSDEVAPATGYSTEEVNQEMKNETTEKIISSMKKGDMEEVRELMTEELGKLLLKEPKVTKTRTRKPVVGQKSSSDPDELIALMEAKIELLRSVKNIHWGGGTGDSTQPKAIRDVYIGIDKDIEEVKAKWIAAIQVL